MRQGGQSIANIYTLTPGSQCFTLWTVVSHFTLRPWGRWFTITLPAKNTFESGSCHKIWNYTTRRLQGKKSKSKTNTMHMRFSLRDCHRHMSRIPWANDMGWCFIWDYSIDYSVHLVHSSSRFSQKTPRYIPRYNEKQRLQLPYLQFTPGAFELPHWPTGEMSACVQACIFSWLWKK